MNFLAPLFLLGGLAVALPVVFHLVRRATKERIPFSSLMFLQAAPPRVSSRNRLEHLILLLLRCLVIALLAMAFARPFLVDLSTANQADSNRRKIILLIDTSASMRREALWADAQAQAAQILNKTTPGDQVAVMTFDGEARSVVSFSQWSALKPEERAPFIIKQLGELKPGWGGTRLGRALIAAAEAFAEADQQRQNIGSRQIYLISDLQEGSRLDGLQGYDWPRGVEVRVLPLQARRATNAGLQWVVDADDSSAPASASGPRIRVSNSANARKEQFQIRWEGVPGAPPVDAYVPPGQSRVVAAPKLPSGAAGERLVVTGDDDDFDNKVYVVQPKPEQIEILFAGDSATNDPARPLYYLERAFQRTRRLAVEIKAHAPSVPFSPEELAGARLMVLAGGPSAGQLADAAAWMTNGATVLLVMDHAASAADAGRLAGLEGLTAVEVKAPNYAMFGQIEFEHPIFSPFADPRFNDFTKIHFWNYRRLDPAGIPGARALARFDDGAPALLEIPRGKGRLLILTSGWQPSDSQLALSSKFVPLLYAVLDLAGGIKAPLAQFHAGDTVDLSSAVASARGRPVTVRKPNGSEVALAAGVMNFVQTEEPGLYTITPSQPPLRFAVNIDPAESRTAPLPVEELARMGVPLKSPEPEPARVVEQKRRLHEAEIEGQQKLWRWLTFAALLVLLIETGLAGWLSRRATLQPEVSL